MNTPIYKTRLTLATSTPNWRGAVIFQRYTEAMAFLRQDSLDIADILGPAAVAAGDLRVLVGSARIELGNGASLTYLGGPHASERMRGKEFDFVDGLNLLPMSQREYWLAKLSER